MAITDTMIRNAKPNGKRQRIFDGGGLYLELVYGDNQDESRATIKLRKPNWLVSEIRQA